MYVDTFTLRTASADSITHSNSVMNDRGEIGSFCLLPSHTETNALVWSYY